MNEQSKLKELQEKQKRLEAIDLMMQRIDIEFIEMNKTNTFCSERMAELIKKLEEYKNEIDNADFTAIE